MTAERALAEDPSSDSDTGAFGRGKPPEEPEYDRTFWAAKRVEIDGRFFEPSDEHELGMFRGRKIIGSGTRINKGVYLGGTEREAIVVDDANDPIMDEVYRDLLGRVTVVDQTERTVVMQAVFDVVQEWLPYDAARAEEIARMAYGDQKLDLGWFIHERVGVCRHQALLAGYLLERLRDGATSAAKFPFGGTRSGAWVRTPGRNTRIAQGWSTLSIRPKIS